MAYSVSGPIGVTLALVDATAVHKLGQEVIGSDGCTYTYCLAGEALAQYAACGVDEDHSATELTTTTAGAVPQPVVVPQIAVASGEYFWGVCEGSGFSVLGAASCAKDVKIYTTATAGVVDDASTTLIVGLRLDETLTGAAAATATASTRMRVN